MWVLIIDKENMEMSERINRVIFIDNKKTNIKITLTRLELKIW